MRSRGLLLAVAVVFALSGCTDAVFKNIPVSYLPSSRKDGAVIGYYLPKAVWKFTASYDGSTGLLSLKADPKPSILPDTSSPMQFLSYAHAGLSDDDVDVKLNGLLLNTVSSTSADQTLKTIEAVNTLLTQVGTTRKTLAKALVSPAVQAKPTLPTGLNAKHAQCTTNLQSYRSVNLSLGTNDKQTDPRHDELWGDHCWLSLQISLRVLGTKLFDHALNVAPFRASQNLSNTDNICNRAICFRPAQIVRVTVTVTLLSNANPQSDDQHCFYGTKNWKATNQCSYVVTINKPGVGPKPLRIKQVFGPVTVPAANRNFRQLGFVEFSRRAFVTNKTFLSFADGVVSEFKSTDPSIFTGVITLASDALKSVVLTVPLVR